MAIGDLCYKKGSGATAGSLIYKKAGPDIGKICYKAPAKNGKVVITFSWPPNATDLDICAYWTNEENLKVGYSYQSSEGTYSSGMYNIYWSGDKRGTGSSEMVEIWRNGPTSATTFTIHFNFYGTAGSAVCDIVAIDDSGTVKTKLGQTCGSASHSAATTGDPSATVSINASGKLIGIS